MNTAPSRLLVLVLLAAAAAAAWTSRPILPPAETQDLAVAWEMWASGDVLVPRLNGEPVQGAAPLSIWMTQAGWLISGPTSLWPRILGLLAAGLSILALSRTARLLWGDRGDPAWRVRAATMVFVGMVFVQVLATTVGGGLWLGVAVLLAWSHLARARDEKRWPWIGLGLATGIGMLAAGPVALLFTLPPWFLGRLWAGPLLPKGWWLGGLRAVGLGLGIYCAWAIPAVWSAGEGFAAALLLGPQREAMQFSLEAGEPRWTMIAFGMLLFPWMLWSPLWRGWISGILHDGPTRMLFLSTAPGIAALIWLRGGLHPIDLVPALPAFALCAGRILETRDRAFTQASLFLPSFATMGLGVFLLFVPANAQSLGLPEWVAEANGTAAGAILMIGGLLLLFLQTAGRGKPSVIAAMGPLALIAMHVGLAAPAKAWDLEPVSRQLANLQRDGLPLAFISEDPYRGQFHFLGQLHDPIAVPGNHAERVHWLEQHPDGAVIVEVPPGLHNTHLVGTGTTMTFQHRQGRFALWRSEELLVVLKKAGHSDLSDPSIETSESKVENAEVEVEGEVEIDIPVSPESAAEETD